MSARLFLTYILPSVLLSSLAQIVMKAGMSSEKMQLALASAESPLAKAVSIALNLQVLAGLSLYGLSAAMWLLVLSKVDVSVAYPFVGLGFIFVALFASMVLNEPFGIVKILGTMFVAAGIAMIAT